MHVLVIGAGEVGFHTAMRLSMEGHGVVVMDIDQEKIRKVNKQIDAQTIEGSGSCPGDLRRAEINRADFIMAVTDSDEVNLLACRFAKILAPSALKIARIRNADILEFLEQGGSLALDVDMVINPEREVARQIVRFISVPEAKSVEDLANGRVKILGLKLPHNSPLSGRPLSKLHPEADSPFLIAAIERNQKVIVPGGDDCLRGNDLLYVVLDKTDINSMVKYFGLHAAPVRNLVLVGGGMIGRQVAKYALAQGIKTRVIERNEHRCQDLAVDLPDAIVLEGDGTDQALLEEENIGGADVFAAVTSEEETNTIVALLARKMGARRTLARVSHVGYVPLAGQLGLDLAVSPRQAAVNAILRYSRRGKVLKVTSLADQRAEVIEAVAQEKSQLVGKPLQQVKLPSGAIIAAIFRDNEIRIPNGRTVISPGDHLIIFLLSQVLPKVEKLMAISGKGF